MSGDDAELVALIDNELGEDAKSSLLAKIAEDDGVRARYEALRETGIPIAAALDALIQKAPLSRLRAALSVDRASQPARWRFTDIALRELAAGFFVGLLTAGAAAWVAFATAHRDEGEDWRSEVAEYTELYTNENFALPSPDLEFQFKKLSVVAERVGIALTPENLSLPGLRFRSADILSYEGSPLGEITYLDARGSPVLFCIIANGGTNTPDRSEKRDGLSLSSWSRGGRGYLVIGRAPEEQVAELAQTLKTRF
jgi:anti-sigma factor RsiW